VPVPRRFDRRPPERDTTRINERIRVPEVRLIDDTGEQRGVMQIDDALRFAQERDLDLVEVAPEAKPPVVRVLDYSKYKYELAQKQKQARKHQQQITIREIKFRPKIAQHDYDTKKGHVERFLRHKDKVKVTIMFRGREVTHPERGMQLLDRLAEELAEYGVVEQRPLHDGRNMTMMLGPSKAVLSGHYDKANGSGNGVAPAGEAAAAVEIAASPNGDRPVAAAAEAEPEPAAAAAVVDPAPAASKPQSEPAAATAVAVEEPAPEPAPEPEPEAAAAAVDAAAQPEPAVVAATEEPAPKPPVPKRARASSAKAPASEAAPKAAAAKPRAAAAKSKPKSDS
jgi:translation initiation factor IF-3